MDVGIRAVLLYLRLHIYILRFMCFFSFFLVGSSYDVYSQGPYVHLVVSLLTQPKTRCACRIPSLFLLKIEKLAHRLCPITHHLPIFGGVYPSHHPPATIPLILGFGSLTGAT